MAGLDDAKFHDPVALMVDLSYLTCDQREAWVDRYILGRPIADIQNTMGIGRETVRQLSIEASDFLMPRMKERMGL